MRLRSLLSLLALLLALAACSEDDSYPETSPADTGAADVQADAEPDAAEDTALPDVPADVPVDVPEDTTPDVRPDPLPAVPPQPDTTALGTRRGLRVARAVIHSHTVHSHDACDGNPRVDGVPNEPCNLDYRHGLCATRMDIAFNTDHEEHAALEDYQTLLLLRDGDEGVEEDGVVVANRMACPDGFHPLILPGGEFAVMPVGLKAHLPGTAEERDQAYNEATPERVESLKGLGAVVLQAHTEQQPLEELRTLGLDGFEIYNLHANLAPDIREEWLGLDPFGFSRSLAPFLALDGPSPDLAFLGFYLPSPPALLKFDTLLAEGQHLVGTAGTDSHQNVLPLAANDGERFDSFRRMMRWFSNHLLVREIIPSEARNALREGRLYAAMESLGTPVGFDYHATASEDTIEMGGEVSIAAGATLHLVRPTIYGVTDDVPMTLVILEAREGGAVEVASGADTLTFTPEHAGAYRAEVRFIPTHLAPYLGPEASAALLQTPVVWVYANPVYVVE